MSGPYAFYEVGKQTLTDTKPATQAAIPVTYLMASFQAVYHLADKLDELLIPPYDAIGQRIVTRGMTDAEVLATPFPKFGRDVLQKRVIQQWLNEPESRLSQILRANETYDWRPDAPLRMYYGRVDVTVLHENALIAERRMRELGAADVQAVELVGLKGEALAHGTAQWPAYIAARRWFDTFAAPSAHGDGPDAGDQHEEGLSQGRSAARALRATRP
jgi:hypothetical protein